MSEVDPFENLEKQLKELDYPHVYMFKFICTSDARAMARVAALFDELDEVNDMVIRPSKNGTYSSISIKELMLSSDAIMVKYREAAKIKGLMIL
jgi:putative lipoic acid-binding regulatory protein